MSFTLIAAVNSIGVIGNNNKLMYKLARDLQFFKENTLAKPVVMGRKTYNSIGRPLPGRETILLTSTPEEYTEVETLAPEQVERFIQLHKYDRKEYMICGGNEIYNLFAEHCSKVLLTEVEDDSAGDTLLPESVYEFVNSADMELLHTQLKDETNEHNFKIYSYTPSK